MWPFFVADGVLVVGAAGITWAQGGALSTGAMAVVLLALALAGAFGCFPYWWRHRPGERRVGQGPGAADEAARLLQRVQKLEFRMAEVESRQGVPIGGAISIRPAAATTPAGLDSSGSGSPAEPSRPLPADNKSVERPAALPHRGSRAAEAATLPETPGSSFADADQTRESEEAPENLLASRLPDSASVRELMARAEVQLRGSSRTSEANLPTSVSELGPLPPATGGLMQRALGKVGGGAGAAAPGSTRGAENTEKAGGTESASAPAKASRVNRLIAGSQKP